MALTFMPPLIAGLGIGLYETILIHRDVDVPTHRFGHSIHAFVIALVASFIVFNVPFALYLFPFLAGLPFVGSTIGVRILVGLIMIIKIHATSAGLKGAGRST